MRSKETFRAFVMSFWKLSLEVSGRRPWMHGKDKGDSNRGLRDEHKPYRNRGWHTS